MNTTLKEIQSKLKTAKQKLSEFKSQPDVQRYSFCIMALASAQMAFHGAKNKGLLTIRATMELEDTLNEYHVDLFNFHQQVETA